jgi:tetratricopeptide (TPR) repeat protein
LRARALGFAGLVATRQGDYTQARVYHESSVPLWRELDNATELANALSWVGLDRWLGGDADEASAILRESLTLARAAGDGDAVATALRNLGMIARSQAQYTYASVLFREAASLAHSSGWHQGYPYARAVSHLGRVAYLEGDSEKASVLFREALVLMRATLTAGHALADCLDWLAAVESKQGNAHQAARLLGAGVAQWQASGAVRYAPDAAAHEHDVVVARGQLGERQFDIEWAWGRAFGADQAIAYALGESHGEGGRAAGASVTPQLPSPVEG